VQFEPINSKYHILEVVKKCLESANEEILVCYDTKGGKARKRRNERGGLSKKGWNLII
jgi:hypothetical protein